MTSLSLGQHFNRDTVSRLSSTGLSSRGSRKSTTEDGTADYNATLLDPGAAEDRGPGGGAPLSLLAPENCALAAHYVCIGVVNGLLQNALQPYCQYVVHGAPNQCSTLATFVNLPWGFKVFYGLLSDAVPICGQHRKPYLIIGWSLTFLGSLSIALLGSFGVPLSLEVIASIFLAITFAYIIADCAADASVVAYTALEPEETRGSLITTAYLIRFIANIFSSSVLAFLFNGPPTEGSFSFGLTTSQLLWIVVGTVALLMAPTLVLLKEPLDAQEDPIPIGERLLEFRNLMAQPAAYRIAIAMTGLTTLSLVTNNASNNANAAWFHMTPLQFGISSAINNVVLSLGMWLFKRYLLNVNWRLSFAFGIVGMQVLGLVYLLTIYVPTFRDGWWIVFTSQDQELAYTLIFAIGVVIIPEIALPGFEGITYGAITTYQNCAQNITAVLNNLLLAIWESNTSDEDIKADTPTVRRHMAYLTVLTVLVALSSLLWLPLLPSQKPAIAQLKTQPSSVLMGNLMMVLLMCGGEARTRAAPRALRMAVLLTPPSPLTARVPPTLATAAR